MTKDTQLKNKKFLPISKQDMLDRKINQLDFIYITGDAYVDHPSFGMAIITRVIEDCGFTVGIISQPCWKSDDDFKKLGKPKYGFMVSSGNIDSMVAHYTVAKKKRNDDFYSPGKIAGKRPDRAVIVYCNKIRQIFGNVPIIIGGLEASLRRFAHYDYWDNCVRRSILIDSGADILSYGMGEFQTQQLVKRLAGGEKVSDIKDIRGICYLEKNKELIPADYIICEDYDSVKNDKVSYAKACKTQYDQQDFVTGKGVAQLHWDVYLVQNPPMRPLKQKELDKIFDLPYVGTYHPCYEKEGGVPAISEVKFSIMHNRGCFGACNFCSIAFHQGRYVTSRSMESILKETEKITQMEDFKGYIHDVGGPSANFRFPSCKNQDKHGVCRGKKCLAPKPCKNIEVDHKEYLEILRNVREVKGVKKVFIRSGIRFDYLLLDKDEEFFKELVAHHVSGQLKVAPEHCSAAVLDKMGKPHIESYIKFMEKFKQLTKQTGKEQYIVPYLMSSHPGSTLKDAIILAQFLKKNNIRPEQVQDFYPTPGTISTCMFYTNLDPYTMEKVFVPVKYEDKQMQRTLLQYYKPENRQKIIDILILAKREDLIGTNQNCLVSPTRKYILEKQNNNHNKNEKSYKEETQQRKGKKMADRYKKSKGVKKGKK
ncbi:MAG: YgiQ family radical SAM protein [Oscillospiraceae bacterium]